MLKLAEYHSKENASNVSVDNVSVVPFLIFLLKHFIMDYKLTETPIMMFN